jgi:hypothetical protein
MTKMNVETSDYYPIGNWIEKVVAQVVKTPCAACKKRRDRLNKLVKKRGKNG